MQIGRMKNEKEAQDYVQSRLLEVKEILDDIADQTGVVYMCLSGDAIRMFGRLGNVMNDALIDIMRIIPDRIEMANTAIDIAYKANEEAEKAKAEQGDLFSNENRKDDEVCDILKTLAKAVEYKHGVLKEEDTDDLGKALKKANNFLKKSNGGSDVVHGEG